MRMLIQSSVLAVAALVLWSGVSAAQVVETPVAVQATFRGTAHPGCRLSSPNAPTSDNAQVSALAPGSADIAINQLVDENATPVGATIVLLVPAVCNQAHTLKLSSLNRGLLGDTPQPATGPFRSLVPYSVTVNWAGGQQILQTSDQTMSVALGDAATGVVTVTIEIPEGGAPLTAGAYKDELVLELGAAG